MKTIGEVAGLAGVSADTLRWYDRLGLVRPRARSGAGYRLYGSEELVRLRQVLVWRQRGFRLADIRALIDDPDCDRARALCEQRELAKAQRDRFQAVIDGIDAALAADTADTADAADQTTVGGAAFAAGALAPVQPDLPDLPGMGNATLRPGTRMTGSPAGRRSARIAPFAAMSGQRISADLGAGPRSVSRVAATDPIRVAESLIALGVLPVGAGSYEDRFTERMGVRPWPRAVEPQVRRLMADFGYYGSDARRISAAAPDVIIDLTAPWLGRPAGSLTEGASGGRYDYDALSAIAPTVLLPYDPGNSGWFGAHAQLRLVAGAFGLVQLRLGGEPDRWAEPAAFAVADPRSGRLSLTSAQADTDVLLSGPGLARMRIPATDQAATVIDLGAETALSLCLFPDMYTATVGDRDAPVVRDGESALARLLAVGQPAAG